MHNAGKGARYTRGRLPVRVLHFWGVSCKKTALREERAFKALSRLQKCARLKEWTLGSVQAPLEGCTSGASEKS